MELRNEIDLDLWNAIKKKYEVEDYTGSIIDAFLSLTETIRNKSGLEGDGSSLIGQAFGGDNPRIKLNKLQTDSEKDVQRGIQDLLRGLFASIRNPRHHDISNDDKSTADSIIVFVDYLLKIVDQSKRSFDENEFLSRIFDDYYVKSKEYSKLLVKEIPIRQRVNIATIVIKNRSDGDIYSLGHFLSALFDELNDAERARVSKVLSDELKMATDKNDIRYLLHLCPGKYWILLDDAVRLRTEEILFDDFNNAIYDPDKKECGKTGWLATWITSDHLAHFRQLTKWTQAAISMLNSGDEGKVAYVYRFFWYSICSANREEITWPLQHYFSKALDKNNKEIIEQLKDQIEYDEKHPWWVVFEEQLKLYPEIVPQELPF